ncbi:MAG: type I DNA topoisomerase [Chlorobiaceae bacterium]|nr:type I DNA topoisomerase [Chlorobiaceae bacterium]MBA4308749.1 type I DNA topoisomerase [Chlorobiaceae bacterium]
MAKNLVLVESPAKAKTINKYLGRDYSVEATIGHIKNLPKSKLGVDPNDGFKAQFLTIRGKGDLVKKIKTLASKVKNIYIATDPDREGESIAQDVAEILDTKNETKIYRVLFNEITKSGIQKGMNNPRPIDSHLVSSQRARRVMDRLIGYKISPFLWKAAIEEAGVTLSAGRVQSVALRLVCEREVEINNFITTEYWSIWAIFETEKGEQFKAKLFRINEREIKTPPKPVMTEEEWKKFNLNNYAIRNAEEAQKIFDQLKNQNDFIISEITKKKTKRNPPVPFITSTLQAEASKALRLKAKQTMGIAQKLYEGVELGKEGSVGLITYMRTDSTRLNADIVSDARDFIKNQFGESYLPPSGNLYEKKKGSNVQDAHEAIRPTSLSYPPEFVKPFLDNNSFKLYQLIWQRFIASQMAPAQLETTVVEISENGFLFKAYGTAVLFDGFTKLYIEEAEPQKEDEKEEARNEKIPAGLEKNQELKLQQLTETQHFTKPLPRFSESTLIKELESKGIGRPSTFSQIVSTIVDRNYAELRERKIFPTHLGMKINEILTLNFPNIFEVGFTARMEAELDQIASGENDYLQVLQDFYEPFDSTLKKVEGKVEKIICEKCGGILDIKIGRFGKYLACTNYPECKNLKSLREYSQQSKPVEFTGDTCEKCGANTVYRNGKFGKFIGCEKYPDCDYIKNITLNLKCPKCNTAEIVERQSKRRKIFYGCSSYPKCDFVSWSKPVAENCPNGDSAYMEEKFNKKKGNFLKCPVCAEEVITKKDDDDSVEE